MRPLVIGLATCAPMIVLAACGPMYQQPGPPPGRGPSAGPMGGPPGGQMDPASDPASMRAPDPVGGAADPAPAAAATPAANPAAGTGRAPGSVAQQFVAAHNRVRAKHCAGPLTWSTKLAAYAQKWAETLEAKGCAFGHSGGPYGENLAAGTEGVLDPEATVAMWYDEINQYKFPDGGFSMNTGHFTQLVWRGTTQVGCGHAQCKGNDIWVCEYDPPGNWDGEYRTNVRPAGCKR